MRRTLGDAEQRAHAELLHLLLAERLHLDPELVELPGHGDQGLGKQNVGRLAHQVAGGEDAPSDLLQLLVEPLCRRGFFHHDLDFLELRLALGLFLGLVLVEAVAAQQGPVGIVGRPLGRALAAAQLVDIDGGLLFADLEQMRADRTAEILQFLWPELGRRAQAGQQDTAVVQVGRCDDLQQFAGLLKEGARFLEQRVEQLALLARKAAGRDRPLERPASLLVEVRRARRQLRALHDTDN